MCINFGLGGVGTETGMDGIRGVEECLEEFRCVSCYECENMYECVRDYNLLTSKNIRILHINIRSYNKNVDELIIVLNEAQINPDVIVLTETWLASGDQYLVEMEGYNYYSCANKRNQNDGVICYISNKFNVTCVDVCMHGATCLKLDMSCGSERFTLLAVYRSPSGDGDLERFVVDLEQYCDSRPRDRTHWLVGDINCCILEGNRSAAAERYLDILYGTGFVSCVDKPTRVEGFSRHLIDHIFIDCKNTDQIVTFVIKSSPTDHYITMADWQISSGKKCVSNSIFRTTKIDHDKLSSLLKETNWISVVNCEDASLCAQLFVTKLCETVKASSSLRTVSKKNIRLKPWITLGILKSIRNRNKISKRAVKEPFNIELIKHFKTYRNYLSNIIKRSKELYFRNKINECGGDPKKLWSHIGEVTGKKNKHAGFPTEHFLLPDNCVNKDYEIANIFNDYFVRVGEELASAVPAGPCVVDDAAYAVATEFRLVPVTECELEACVRELRGGSAPGVDNLFAFVIKEHFIAIKEALLKVVNNSIGNGVFPDIFKVAKVIPLFKGGNKGQCCNYRPISLLSVVGKILEKCIKKQLTKYLSENKIICSNQFGFRSDLNYDDAFFNLVNDIHNKINKNSRTLLVFIDLAKAFDSLDRDILIHKLSFIGCRGNALDWFVSYLSDRKQLVSVKESSSKTKELKYGVIQGSTLGPLLFSIYINNISKLQLNKGEMYLYADDTALCFEGKNWEEAYQNAECGLLTVKRWFDQNRLTVNVGKTKYMAVSLRAAGDPGDLELHLHTCRGRNANVHCDCEPIERVEHYKYLGVMFDNRLSWSAHVRYLNSKLRRCVYMFHVLSGILDFKLLRTVYFAYIQSILQHGIIIWGGAYITHIQPLLVTQKLILKRALRKPIRYPSDDLFETFEVLDIKQLFIKVILMYSFKYKHNFYEAVHHTYFTRHQVNMGINTPLVTKTISTTNAKYLAHILFSNLPKELKEINTYSKAVFKKKITLWLLVRGREASYAMLHSVYAP